MIEHTLDRALRLSRPEHIVTVVARGHVGVLAGRAPGAGPWASVPMKHARPSTLSTHPALSRGTVLVLQPENRDTAAGVFLALDVVRRADAAADVVILPSDHFVYPDDALMRPV